MSSASKRTVLITGCSDGSLGAALALSFHRTGEWRVFASGRNLARLKVVAEAGIETVQLDTTLDASIAAAVSQVEKLTGGSLDCLVNNAGAGYTMPLVDIDIAQAQALFNLNVWSIISVTRAFLPLLMNSKWAGGAIVANNTSISSQIAGSLPYSGVYSASKAAAASLTESLRVELAALNVRVINLLTGTVTSGFINNRVSGSALPESSVYYKLAKDEVETVMASEDLEVGTDPNDWANTVVADLSKKTPPHWIWAGKFAWLVRLSNFLPIGFLDGTMKKMTKLDAVEAKIKAQRAEAKSKTV